MTPTIAILSGGFSCERKISLMSGKAVKKALDSLSYKAIEIDVDSGITEKLKEINPTLAFIALHGSYGEDGCIQGLLEILGIKYTHSGVMASAIAMNKKMSKHIFQSLGIDTPKGHIISREDILKNNMNIEYPYVLKPNNEGSSIGIHMVFSHEDYLKLRYTLDVTPVHEEKQKTISVFQNWDNMKEKTWVTKNYLRDSMLIEEYIPGVELHTAILLDEAICTTEIRSKNKFYDYEAKYTDGFAEHIFPAEIPDNVYKMTLKHALKVHKFLGCKTISRSDFRYNPKDNNLKMLEINTHPGLTEFSLVPKILKLIKGIDFNELVKIIVEDSLQHKSIRDQINAQQCY